MRFFNMYICHQRAWVRVPVDPGGPNIRKPCFSVQNVLFFLFPFLLSTRHTQIVFFSAFCRKTFLLCFIIFIFFFKNKKHKNLYKKHHLVYICWFVSITLMSLCFYRVIVLLIVMLKYKSKQQNITYHTVYFICLLPTLA